MSKSTAPPACADGMRGPSTYPSALREMNSFCATLLNQSALAERWPRKLSSTRVFLPAEALRIATLEARHLASL
jgi:hypothetical protein